jgi:hypothetical protein
MAKMASPATDEKFDSADKGTATETLTAAAEAKEDAGLSHEEDAKPVAFSAMFR